MKSYVSVSNDLSAPSISLHNALVAGVPTPIAEPAVTMFWAPGMLCRTNAFTSNVLHQGLPMCLNQHDLGPLLPHLRSPPDPLDAVATTTSFRKHLFSGSTVRANAKGLGACGFLQEAVTPALACGDPVPVPHPGNATMALKNTVQFRITGTDLEIGLADLCTEMLIGVAGNIGGNVVTKWAFKNAAKFIKNATVGGYKAVFEDGAAAIQLDMDVPLLGSLVQRRVGWARDANGNGKWEERLRLGPYEAGVDIDFDLGFPFVDPVWNESP
jgi:hypothetical protein